MSTRKSTIKFTRAPAQAELIRRCVARADAMYRAAGGAPDKIGLEMDLSAVNANGCPIDFERLLAFDDGNFLHDIAGVQNTINRRTGHLSGGFVPRRRRRRHARRSRGPNPSAIHRKDTDAMTAPTLTLLEAAKKALNVAEDWIDANLDNTPLRAAEMQNLEDVRAAINAEDGCKKITDEPSTFNAFTEDKYLIWSTEYRAWFREERLGYCTPVAHAGRYSRDEAIAICQNNNDNEWSPRGVPPRIPVRESDIAACAPPADVRENFRQMTNQELLNTYAGELMFIGRINVTAGFKPGDHSGWDINLMTCELLHRLGVPSAQWPVRGPLIEAFMERRL